MSCESLSSAVAVTGLVVFVVFGVTVADDTKELLFSFVFESF